MTIGEAHQTVRSANGLCDDRGQQGVEHNIFVHFLVRCAKNIQIMFPGFFSLFGPLMLLAQGVSVRQ
jgi:hypothetical protein